MTRDQLKKLERDLGRCRQAARQLRPILAEYKKLKGTRHERTLQEIAIELEPRAEVGSLMATGVTQHHARSDSQRPLDASGGRAVQAGRLTDEPSEAGASCGS